MSTGDRTADRDPVDVLAEEFVARYRRGERPVLAEYVEGYPGWPSRFGSSSRPY